MLDRAVVGLLRMPLTSLVASEDRQLLRSGLTELRKTGEHHQLSAVSLRTGHVKDQPVRLAASKDHPASRQIRWVLVPASVSDRGDGSRQRDRKSTRLNSSHANI